MSFLGAVGGAAGSGTPLVLWVLGGVIIALAGALIVTRKAKTRARRKDERPAFAIAETCRSKGHAYQEFDTGWRCVTCGNHVPRKEGELYGLVSDGRHERRRSAR